MIKSFKGEHDWLSNFAPCAITLAGTTYPSVENAYQAAKTADLEERKQFANCSASRAKRLGRKVTIRPNWDSLKLMVMRDLCEQKFTKEPYRTLLLGTGDQEIVEGNWWGDTYWGVCKGEGQNHLGKLIMKIRSGLEELV